MKIYDIKDMVEIAQKIRRPFHSKYLAMYSSVIDGIVTDPALMTVPVDDHIVHRGDGVFETMKCLNGNIYNLESHLMRLKHSATALYHELPKSEKEISNLIVETVKVAGKKNCSIRLLISRGPGSFDVNPYDCPESQIYIIVTDLKSAFMELHPEGATVMKSRIPVKPSFFAGLKSCNYLPNVLMKKEAIDGKVDFVVGFDANGFLAEGATENVGIITADNRLLFPKLDSILCGTTMMRVIELADTLINDGVLSDISQADITYGQVANAAEIILVGTTINVVRVREFDHKPIGISAQSKAVQCLSELLKNDIDSNISLQTKAL